MVTLNMERLWKLGNEISRTLAENNATKKSTLTIEVDEQSLHKIDEDVFYHMRDKDSKEELIPSYDKVILHFPYLDIEIKKEADV